MLATFLNTSYRTDRHFVYSPDSKDVGAWGGVHARATKKEEKGLFPKLIKRLGEMLLRRAEAGLSDIPFQLELIERVGGGR